jgi:replicative DNA helicase
MKKQVTPNSPEVEAAVLGALMSKPNMIDEIAGLCSDFSSRPANAQVFGVIRDIRAAGGVPNIVAVTQVLASHDRLEFVGGAGAVTDMVATPPVVPPRWSTMCRPSATSTPAARSLTLPAACSPPPRPLATC